MTTFSRYYKVNRKGKVPDSIGVKLNICVSHNNNIALILLFFSLFVKK